MKMDGHRSRSINDRMIDRFNMLQFEQEFILHFHHHVEGLCAQKPS